MQKETNANKRGEVRKIYKTGEYTHYVTIPKVEIDALGWRANQRVVVKRVGNRIIIEKPTRGTKR
ncbi:MAG: bifunctional DNA-binding transcriptional regulator [Kiritimatiellia bacterium]|jgi:bifunctional DNA-binding transcriptional regulator/antitoxin component of YhaV-PrlF toxin-antitoxin module